MCQKAGGSLPGPNALTMLFRLHKIVHFCPGEKYWVHPWTMWSLMCLCVSQRAELFFDKTSESNETLEHTLTKCFSFERGISSRRLVGKHAVQWKVCENVWFCALDLNLVWCSASFSLGQDPSKVSGYWWGGNYFCFSWILKTMQW